ncbi:DUF6538 domain-containing protein [Roseomonas mucosa]
MAKVPGYLEQRRQSWEAVVDVPPTLREAVGRKRLRKGLGTRDKAVAKARLPRALLELHRTIEEARKAHPKTDPLTAEAMALREQREMVKAGRWAVTSTHEVWDPDAGAVVEVEADDAEHLITDAIQARSEELRKQEGPERAATFTGLAMGTATPLDLHVEEWLAEPGQRGAMRERTKGDYRRIVRELSGWLAKDRLAGTVEAILRRVAGRYVQSLHAEGLSSARIRTITAALSGYWQWMERRGVATEGANPWTKQAPKKAKSAGGKKEPERPFTDAEVALLLNGRPDPLLDDAMRIAALTGMRLEEICRLTVRGCEGGVFDAPGTKTEAAARRLPIHPDLAPIVARRCAGKPLDAFLFHELKAQPATGERSPALSKRFGRYRQEVGVHEREEGRRRSRVNFHSFRRWFITKALQAGQPERVVKQVVGHSLQGDVTLGVYFGGDLMPALRECVEAVRLPD